MKKTPQYPTRFPFLSLPRELQAEVVRFVGDVAALRDLLAIPQVIKSVAPFLRLITDGSRPHWFVGLEKYVQHRVIPFGLPRSRTGRDGFVYILDIEDIWSFQPDCCKFLWMPIVVVKVADHPEPWEREQPFDEDDDTDDCRLEQCISLLTVEMGVQTLGIVGDGVSCHLIFRPEWPVLPANLTMVNIESLYLRNPLVPFKNGQASLPAIRYIGSLSTLSIDIVPKYPYYQSMSMLYDRYQELIDNAKWFEVAPREVQCDDVEAEGMIIQDWDVSHLRGHYQFLDCHKFCNIRLNTGYTEADAVAVSEGILFLDMSCLGEELGDPHYEPNYCFERPIIQNVVATRVRELTITASGPYFPRLGMLWFPHLRKLQILCGLDHNCKAIQFKDEMDTESIQELSRLVYLVDELELNQFTVPLLGLLLPSSFDNITTMTLKEYDMIVEYNEKPLEKDIGLLKSHDGNICMPKLRELHWSTSCRNEEQVLEFSWLSQYFEFPVLETVLMDTRNEGVSLKDIAGHTPRIKELKIRAASSDYPYVQLSKEKGIYPTPDIHFNSTTFELLERLFIDTGYHCAIFHDVFFPHLKSLELSLHLDRMAPNRNLVANMPVLEELTITATPQSEGNSYIGITGFKNLRLFSLTSDVQTLCLNGCIQLEQMTHTGLGLHHIQGMANRMMENLKVLRYSSNTGKACHTFKVRPSADVDIRRGGDDQ